MAHAPEDLKTWMTPGILLLCCAVAVLTTALLTLASIDSRADTSPQATYAKTVKSAPAAQAQASR